MYRTVMEMAGMEISAGSVRKTAVQVPVTLGAPRLIVDAGPGRTDTISALIEDAEGLWAFRGHDPRITGDLYPPAPPLPGERLRAVSLASLRIRRAEGSAVSPVLSAETSPAVLSAITARGWRPAGLHDLVRYAIDPGGWDRSATVTAPSSIVTIAAGDGSPVTVIGVLAPAGGRGYLDLSELGSGHGTGEMLLVAESR